MSPYENQQESERVFSRALRGISGQGVGVGFDTLYRHLGRVI